MSLRDGLMVMVLGAAALAAIGCKSGDDGTGGGGGGTGGGQQAAPVVLPPNQNGQSCASEGGSCTDQAEIDTYADCIVTTCDPAYKQCFGDDYLNGNYGGACQSLMECAKDCQDCDSACLQACSDQHYTDDCKSCMTGPIVDCVVDALKTQKCKIPCGPMVGGASCTKLEACCNSLTDETEKSDCLELHGNSSLGGEMSCKLAFDTYVSSGKCM